MITYQDIIIRLITATLLGAIVGCERERHEWAAGLRTHMLVCVGATLIMIVSAYGFNDVITASRIVLDPSRVAAQVVSGIGFLGAGTILFLRQEVIRGLTTAASLWTVAAVGLAVGCGLYVAAICTVALILVILALVKPLEKRIFRRDAVRRVIVRIDRNRASLLQIEMEVESGGLEVKQIMLKRGETAEEGYVEFELLRSVSKEKTFAVIAKLQGLEGVRDVTL